MFGELLHWLAMSRFLGRSRDAIVNAVLGIDLRANVAAFQQSLASDELVQREANEFSERFRDAEREIVHINHRLDAGVEVLKSIRDDIPTLRLHLELIRSSPDHVRAIEEADPLVTVRIASYQNTDALMDLCLPSVFAQTYQNLEVIVVNDGPNDRTRRALEALADPRVRYTEFASRNVYPEDSHARWMVAGSPGMNRGAELARGTWVAPLDDDDEFTPDHVEKLLSLARQRGVELAYGALVQRNIVNGDQNHIFSDPPAMSQFSFQGAIYLSRLTAAFRYDEQSWLVSEPGDWNLIRRMRAAGVTMAATPDVVAVMHHVPYTHKAER